MLVLASASPRRRELLARLGIEFEVTPARADEREPHPSETPAQYALELARHKARTVSMARPDSVVLAADTVVALGGCFLGKPRDDAEARAMLSALRDRTHVVVTGVAVRCKGAEYVGTVSSRVRMRPYSEDEIAGYIATGEPRDKAGAYAVQGIGRALVESVHGCLETVIGLPLCLSSSLLGRCCKGITATEALCHHCVCSPALQA